MDPYDWLNRFYSFYAAAVVSIVSRRGFTIDAWHENQPNKDKLALCIPSVHFNSSLKWLYISNKMDYCSYKDGCGVMHGEAFKRRASLGYI